MKILNLEDFVKLPVGTVYAKYKPCVFDEMCVKGESINESDWYYSTFTQLNYFNSSDMFEILDDAENNMTSFGLNFNLEARDGCFE